MVSMYSQVCPVLFGADAIEEIGSKALEMGCVKALCVFDAGVKASGIASRVEAVLRASGLEVGLCDGVLPEAPDSFINEVGKSIFGKGYDLVIGIGGGSSLDTAKAVCVLAENPAPISNYYAGNDAGAERKSTVKLILVPTASGTGSEVTVISVIHDMEKDRKETVLKAADLAIVDPVLTVTCPPNVTAASALDAMSHAVEAYTSNAASPKSDLLALHAVELIAANVEKAYRYPSDLNSREALSFASNIAGIAFCDASVHAGHCAAHEIGVKLGIPHGVACAIAMPVIIRFVADAVPGKMRDLAGALGCKASVEPLRTADSCADEIYALMRRLGIKSLSEMGFARDEVIACARGAVDNNWFHIRTPKPVTYEAMEKILAEMYDRY